MLMLRICSMILQIMLQGRSKRVYFYSMSLSFLSLLNVVMGRDGAGNEASSGQLDPGGARRI
jgi:hypothetical protein